MIYRGGRYRRVRWGDHLGLFVLAGASAIIMGVVIIASILIGD